MELKDKELERMKDKSMQLESRLKRALQVGTSYDAVGYSVLGEARAGEDSSS